MRFDARALTSLIMFLIFLGACVLALEFDGRSRLLPLLVGVPGAVICGIQVLRDLRKSRSSGVVFTSAEMQSFGWLTLFFGALLSLGFVLAGPLLTAAYVRLKARAGWTASLGAGLGTFVILFGVFETLIGVQLYGGLFFE